MSNQELWALISEKNQLTISKKNEMDVFIHNKQ